MKLDILPRCNLVHQNRDEVHPNENNTQWNLSWVTFYIFWIAFIVDSNCSPWQYNPWLDSKWFLLYSCSEISSFYNTDYIYIYMSFLPYFLALTSQKEPIFMQFKRDPRSCQCWLPFIIHGSLPSSSETYSHKY